MTSVSEEPAQTSWIGGILLLVMHQVIVAVCVLDVSSKVVHVLPAWIGWMINDPRIGWLTGSPFFPAQIGLALFLGWSLGGWLQHRSMVWVWLIPTAIMGCFVSIFPWYGQIADRQYWYLSSYSRFSHFFGTGCRPEGRCFDQLLITVQFYGAVAYSIGAYLARVKRVALLAYAETMSQIRLSRAALVGLATVCYDLIQSWRQDVPVMFEQPWDVDLVLFLGLLIELALVTYVFIVAISLFGRRTYLARWFLKAQRPDRTSG